MWGPAEFSDIRKRRKDGQTLKEIGAIYGISGNSIRVKLRRADYLDERAALEENRRLKFREWDFEDNDSFVNDEDQHKEEDYYV
jgi:hypothetical protein